MKFYGKIVNTYEEGSMDINCELKKLRETLETITDIDDIADTIIECHALLNQLQEVTADNSKLSADDFRTVT